jgi:uncharacterized protein (TIGR02996 family)
MGHDEAFLRDIIEHADDDAPRLIYADWLQDHGQPERAEFIRLQCRLAAAGALDDPDRWALLAREQQLLREHGKGWARALRRLVKRWRFRRGFVEWVALPARTFLSHGDELFRLSPVRDVRLLGEPVEVPRRNPNRGRGPSLTLSLERLLPDVLESPHLARLRGLDLSNQLFELFVFDALIDSQHFPRLRRLDLSGTSVCSDEGFDVLASAEQLEELEELRLSGRRNGFDWSHGEMPPISEEAMAALAHSPHLRNVTRLRLGCGANDLSSGAIAALAASPLLEQLGELSVTSQLYRAEEEELLAWLASSGRVARLRVVRLHRPLPGKVSLDSVLTSPHLANLRCLDLSRCALEGVGPLADAPHLSNLRELNLSGCRIDGEGLQALARARGLPRLAALNLDQGLFSAEVLREFAHSPLMGQLRWLSVKGLQRPVVGRQEPALQEDMRVGDTAAELFATSPRTAGLVHLDLGNQCITDAGLRTLAESPHLANLMTLRLWNNEIGDAVLWNAADPLRSAGVSALVLSEHLQRLVTVDLRSNPLPRVAQLALRQRFGYGVCYGRGPLPQAAHIALPGEAEDESP